MKGSIRAMFSGRNRSRLRTGASVAISGALMGALIVTATSLSFGEGSGRAFLLLIPILGIAYLIVRIHRAEVSAGLRSLDDLMRTHLSTIEALTIAIDAKDPLSRGHVRRVQAYALALASRMRIPKAQLQGLRGDRRRDPVQCRVSLPGPADHQASPRTMGWIRLPGRPRG
jgi:hypothetical protein